MSAAVRFQTIRQNVATAQVSDVEKFLMELCKVHYTVDQRIFTVSHCGQRFESLRLTSVSVLRL